MTAAEGVIGREDELATISAFLAGLASGPAGLVLQGEAGAGKTTLWRAGVDAALELSFRVLAASPAETETAMSFAALGDLLADAAKEVLPELPPPQRNSLEVALLLAEAAEGPAPDQRAVAVAFLNALRVLSASRPVLVAVDDVQWLDTSSANVIGFAGRRLSQESVGLLLAERTTDRAGLPLDLESTPAATQAGSMRIGPLTLGALHRLLHTRLDLVVPRPVLRRIHDASGGNPFFALEIGRALELEGQPPVPGRPLPVPESLDELLRARIAALPRATREALLLAAGLSEPRLALLEAALDADPRSVLRPAIEAQVLALDGDRIRFAHPLLASASYESADEVERRGVHRRLAVVVDEVEERARHVALAATGPDEELATVLERAAAHARTRGATAAAAELCEQSLRLTPTGREDDVHRRTIALARYRFVAGDTANARALLEAALPSAHAGGLRAEALVLLGRLHRYEGDQTRAAELLQQALAEEGADDEVRADAAQGLAATLFFMREDLEAGVRHAALAAELAARAHAPALRAEALATKGLIQGVLGSPEATATVAEAEGAEGRPDRVDASAAWARGYLSLWTDRLEQAAAIMGACYEDAFTRGDESSIPRILASLALVEYAGGRWQEAERLADEGYELGLQTAQRPQQAFSVSARALVRASLGREPEARADADEALALASDRGMAVARIYALWALGLLELSLDRPDETARLLAPERERLLAAGVGEPGTMPFVPDEIEALVALGRYDEAEALLDWLGERGRALDRASALAAAGRCRGVLAATRGETDLALAAFESALGAHERVRMPFERARTLLALGSVHRRARKRSAARDSFAEALRFFEEVGAARWVERTRDELARVGGRAPSGWELTASERQVAELVGDGLTNREVAARLHLTQKTVEFHLRNVFRKLGVRSRTELARSPALKH